MKYNASKDKRHEEILITVSCMRKSNDDVLSNERNYYIMLKDDSCRISLLLFLFYLPETDVCILSSNQVPCKIHCARLMKNLTKYNSKTLGFQFFHRVTESRKLNGRRYGVSSHDEKRHCKKVIAAAKTRVRHVEAAALSAL